MTALSRFGVDICQWKSPAFKQVSMNMEPRYSEIGAVSSNSSIPHSFFCDNRSFDPTDPGNFTTMVFASGTWCSNQDWNCAKGWSPFRTSPSSSWLWLVNSSLTVELAVWIGQITAQATKAARENNNTNISTCSEVLNAGVALDSTHKCTVSWPLLNKCRKCLWEMHITPGRGSRAPA